MFRNSAKTLLPACLLIFCSSCFNFKQLQKNSELILSMERTPCYGQCPVYEIQLYNNGLLIYNGKRFTQNEGCRFTKLSKKQVNALINELLYAEIFSFEDKYPVNGLGPTDLPGCNIYFKNGGREKRIADKGWQTPENLMRLEKKVDSLILRKKLQFCDN